MHVFFHRGSLYFRVVHVFAIALVDLGTIANVLQSLVSYSLPCVSTHVYSTSCYSFGGVFIVVQSIADQT